jgi:23S rRNA (cytidine1920-2'-O)/16S rRNA (cytidine1409-2'-O)-methyltransferase
MRRRLDAELVRRKLVVSRTHARQAIDEGLVLVDGVAAAKPSRQVGPDQDLTVTSGRRYLSRGGVKLEGALDDFGLDPSGSVCLDVGAATGGFTDCLLQRGAGAVLAVDVGTGQLHPDLRGHPRVESLEQTDIRHLPSRLADRRFDLIVGDLSFVSLRLIIPALVPLAAPEAPLVLLVKPQFEVGPAAVTRGRGVIRRPELWRRGLSEVVAAAGERGLGLGGATVSPIAGGSGNIEFFVLLAAGTSVPHPGSIDGLLDAVVARAEARDL